MAVFCIFLIVALFFWFKVERFVVVFFIWGCVSLHFLCGTNLYYIYIYVLALRHIIYIHVLIDVRGNKSFNITCFFFNIHYHLLHHIRINSWYLIYSPTCTHFSTANIQRVVCIHVFLCYMHIYIYIPCFTYIYTVIIFVFKKKYVYIYICIHAIFAYVYL